MIRFSFTYLGSFCFLLSLLSFVNILYSYYFNLYLNVNTYTFTLIISLILGIFFYLSPKFLNFKDKEEIKITIYSKIIIVIFGYFFFPLIISLPYYLSIYNIAFIDSYFESISGFTSTGFTMFENIRHLDSSLILWRSTSQWIGGLYFLFSIILLIDIFDNNLKKSLTSFLSFNTSETLKQSFKVLILYSVLTFVIFIILKVVNIRNFDSFNLSLSIISSGGFISTNSFDSFASNDIKKILLSLTFLISFFSIFLPYNVIFIRKKNLNVFSEDFYLLMYFLFLLIIFFIFFNTENNFPNILLSITSSISNIGIFMMESENEFDFLFLTLVIIGGSFFSNSSGIRFLKIFTLFNFSINNLISHSKPKQVIVQKNIFGEKNVDQQDINKYFFSVLIFVLSLSAITILLTLSDINFIDSFKLGILTIMNTVNSSLYGLETFDFSDINFFSKNVFILFMIIGRVELITILILVKKYLLKY